MGILLQRKCWGEETSYSTAFLAQQRTKQPQQELTEDVRTVVTTTTVLGICMTRTNAPPSTHRTDGTGGRSKTKHRSRSKRLVWRVSSRPSEGPSPLVEQPESNAVVHRPLDHRRPQAAKKSFAEPLSSRDLAQRVKEPPNKYTADKERWIKKG